MTTPDRDYRLMLNALSDVTRRRDAELENAERAYRDSAERAAGELARAEGDATAADRWAGAAAAAVIDVDREAARLWDQLRRAGGLRVRSLGDLPDPAPIEVLPRITPPRTALPRTALPQADLPRTGPPPAAPPPPFVPPTSPPLTAPPLADPGLASSPLAESPLADPALARPALASPPLFESPRTDPGLADAGLTFSPWADRPPAAPHGEPDADSVSSGRMSAQALLARAAGRIDQRVRPVARRPLQRWALPLLPVLGALIAAAAGLVAAGLVTIGGTDLPGGSVIRALGWLVFLVAPSAGVPLAAVIAHRRFQARLDVGGVSLTLLGGMVAATLLSLSFANSH